MRRRLFPSLPLACALGVAAITIAITPAPAHADLPSVTSGHRPGPDALYDPPPARVPQLENTGVWKADPILVSGAVAYRKGEFVYQDFLYDDHGAFGVKDLDDPIGPGEYLFSPTAGTLTYPTDQKRYAHNAADLVELRVKPLADATAFRVTLNTLLDKERTAFTIALGGEGGDAKPWPHGAGVRSPADAFLTVHGDTAELTGSATGTLKATVDMERRQIEVRVPHSLYDPGTRLVRMAAGVGLWDPDAKAYLAPSPGRATSTTPGGAAPNRAAIFNLAFRTDEKVPDITQGGAGVTMGDAAAGAIVDAKWWRERGQADALASGDVGHFNAQVDFAKLAAGTTDDSRVPATGVLNRILASRHTFGQGIDHAKKCFGVTDVPTEPGAKCQGRYLGRLQPYSLYVPPTKPVPQKGWGLTFLLHSLSANYNQYSGSKNQSQLGERGTGSLVATPNGRGPDGFYAGMAEADMFEVWADVARHYRVDPTYTAVSGYSMGGFGTFRMLARWPDLFARGFAVVAAPGSVAEQLGNLRNTPLLDWVAAADELVNIGDTEESVRLLTAAGVRFDHWLFPLADHLTLATNDEYGPGAAFLGEHRVDRDPPHVTYATDTTEDSAEARTVADHAYWVSDVRARTGERATIDVRSLGFGVGDPPVRPLASSNGMLEGGSRGPMPYNSRAVTWGDAPSEPKRDTLVVKATNVASATIDARRARVSCAPQIEASGDPVNLTIACTPPKSCASVIALKVPRVKGRRIVSVRVTRGKRTLTRSRSRNVRTVRVWRPTKRAFTLKLRARTNRGGTVTVTRRVKAC